MTKKYTAIIDVDTLIIHSALAGQQSSVIVRHKDTGWTREFPNQTEFFGHYLKKDGGWLADLNSKKAEKGLECVSPDAFEIISKIEIIPAVGDVTPEVVVKGRFKNKIEFIANQPWCKDFKICFGQGKNFRYDIAETVPYKNERPEKPLLYDVVKDYMLWKYKEHLISAEGVETDDIVAEQLWDGWMRAKRQHDNLDVVGVFIDKDLAQFPCLQFNFDKPELGLIKIEALDAAKNLGAQFLMGDTIDTIPGLPTLTPELFKKYGLRKTKGLGEKTARGVVEGSSTPKEVFERVVEAYREYYGEDKSPFENYKGEKSERNWLDHMNEMYRLLRMRTDITKDVGHVSEFLNKLGVNYVRS